MSQPGPTEINFTAFILSLSTAALQHMGQLEREGQQPAANLPLAQQTIDILAMLQEKTRDNLTAEEDKLLANVLYDLRMRYVEKARGASG